MPPLLTQIARVSDGLPLAAIQTPAPSLPVTSSDQQEAKELLRKITTGWVFHSKNDCKNGRCRLTALRWDNCGLHFLRCLFLHLDVPYPHKLFCFPLNPCFSLPLRFHHLKSQQNVHHVW